MPFKAETPTFDIESVPEKDRERVSALIPSPAWAEGYVHRDVQGINDFEYLDGAIEDQENVLLVGPTGSSKSTLFRAYAAERQLPLAIVESNASMDLSTVIGRLDPQTLEFVYGEFTLVLKYGGYAVIEEINMNHPRINAGLHQLLSVVRNMSLPENGETIKAGRGGLNGPQPVGIAAAMNPKYQGTVRMNEALLNRFAIQLQWDYDREVELELLDSPRLVEMAFNIRSLAEIRTPVSTNCLQELERHYRRYGWAAAADMFLNRFDAGEKQSIGGALEGHGDIICREIDEADQSNSVGALIADYQPVKRTNAKTTRRRTR
jgi:AAA domain (dynein-related subfamily)